ncbi:hypothetical protein NQZ68_007734 [Dissostichus eleginoides]|nr:hypothetical protein NQZ68_007734 [Dissostichus eleginoides]
MALQKGGTQQSLSARSYALPSQQAVSLWGSFTPSAHQRAETRGVCIHLFSPVVRLHQEDGTPQTWEPF